MNRVGGISHGSIVFANTIISIHKSQVKNKWQWQWEDAF
jgi:hypothetical protein